MNEILISWLYLLLLYIKGLAKQQCHTTTAMYAGYTEKSNN